MIRGLPDHDLPQDVTGFKTCIHCNLLKPIKNFGVKNKIESKNGTRIKRDSFCRSCRQKHLIAQGKCPRCRSGILSNGFTLCEICAAKGRVRSNKLRAKLRKIVFDHYGNKCCECGEDIAPFLTLDHVDNSGSMHKTKAGNRVTGTMLFNEIIDSGFPDRFQILCFNCNCAKQRRLQYREST